MEYLFGNRGKIEILKTKGNEYSDLKGYHEIEREYPDQTITDRFFIRCKLESEIDEAGDYCVWYEIDHHYRYVDRTRPVKEALEEATTEMEDALCEIDESNEERIAAIEDALCEIDAGGN